MPDTKEVVTVNEDELVGYIIRTAHEDGIRLTYEEVNAVLNAEMDFLASKGLVDMTER